MLRTTAAWGRTMPRGRNLGTRRARARVPVDRRQGVCGSDETKHPLQSKAPTTHAYLNTAVAALASTPCPADVVHSLTDTCTNAARNQRRYGVRPHHQFSIQRPRGILEHIQIGTTESCLHSGLGACVHRVVAVPAAGRMGLVEPVTTAAEDQTP